MTHATAEQPAPTTTRPRAARWRGWFAVAAMTTAVCTAIGWQVHRSTVQTALDNRLIDAVLNSDVAGAREALRRGANPGTVVGSAWPEANMWPSVRRMLTGGPGTRSSGTTALMQASAQGDGAIVDMLLGAGADVNREDQRGWTALMWACYHRGRAYAPALLRQGAQVNHAAKDGQTALLIAVEAGDTAIARMLLNAGASTSVTDSNGHSLMHAARPYHSAELNRLLKQHGAR